MNLLEKILIGIVILVPIGWFIFLTVSNQIYGVDSYYWLLFGFKQPVISNLAMVMMWFSIFFLFSFVKGNRSSYLIASFFLLNLFCLRFLEVEMDDFIVYLLSFIPIVWLKSKFPYKDYHKILALLIVAGYLLSHLGMVSDVFRPNQDMFSEAWKNPVNMMFILPTIYLFWKNGKWKELAFVSVFFILFMSGKGVTSILPVFVFAVYLDFLTDREFKFSRNMLLFFLTLFVMVMLMIPIMSVNNNNQAFEDYCDVSTRICDNSNLTSWYYGHYFAWKGYYSNNPSNYGLFCCAGSGCLNETFSPYQLIPDTPVWSVHR